MSSYIVVPSKTLEAMCIAAKEWVANERARRMADLDAKAAAYNKTWRGKVFRFFNRREYSRDDVGSDRVFNDAFWHSQFGDRTLKVADRLLRASRHASEVQVTVEDLEKLAS